MNKTPVADCDLSQYIESYPDFPKRDVVYWDFTPLLSNPEAFRAAVKQIRSRFADSRLTKIAAIEAKGFTLGAALAYDMELPLVLIRKPELVPGQTEKEQFVKEYGTGEYQVKTGQFAGTDNVLIIYDIMAGAGATRAAINLVERSNAKVAGCAFVIELAYLEGREQLSDYNLFSLVKIDEKPEIKR